MSGPGWEGSLQVSNKKVMNSLSTKSVDDRWDNLWAICGATVDCYPAYRMVERSGAFMRHDCRTRPAFY